jgi:hypothetical protein
MISKPPRAQPSLSLLILGQRVRVECRDPALRQVIAANFAAMATAADRSLPDLRYDVVPDTSGDAFSLVRQGSVVDGKVHSRDLLFALEQDITVQLQLARADLFFLHAAAIERDGAAYLLAAASGSGKSTTTWGMLHHGFGYLSDELSPLDIDAMRVHAYPHALCLKADPPSPYALPSSAIRLGRRIHVPVDALPAPTATGPCVLRGVFLVAYRSDLAGPEVRAIGAAEASARLYTTALNALAHPNQGLEGVTRIAQHVPCFELLSSDLAASCALLRSTITRIARA